MRNEQRTFVFLPPISLFILLQLLNLVAQTWQASLLNTGEALKESTQEETAQFYAEQDTDCNCQWQYLKHYPVKGCTPVYGPAPCRCPVRFECSNSVKDTINDNKCEVDGRHYQIGEAVNTSNNCEVCNCRLNQATNKAVLSCTLIECPHTFRPTLPAGCYQIYEEGRCCPTGSKCANQTQGNEPVCYHNSREYKIGQKIHPEEDPCMVCLCTREWIGIDGPGCRRHDCQIQRDLGKLQSGCIPIYHERTCCPIEYHCVPDEHLGGQQNSTLLDRAKIPEQCRHPAEFGTCQEAFPRYHFNNRRRRCEEFLYSGCGGNENRFATMAECENLCGSGRNGLEERSRKPTGDQCVFGQRYYTVGEILDINHPTHCVTCTCSVPPDFTCIHRSCPPPPGNDYERCTAEYKPGACCAQYTCQPKPGIPATRNKTSERAQNEETCVTPQCDTGCRVDDYVPSGTCSGCMCEDTNQKDNGGGHTVSRNIREARDCPRVDVQCVQRPGCKLTLKTDGCTECTCGDESAPSLCLSPNCACPIDAKCPDHGCRLYNSSTPGKCSVCRCSSGRSLDTTADDRVQCPSSSKCPEGCQLTTATSDNCPACLCEPDEARPCLPPLCLCSPPRCEPGCKVDRRVPLGRCPGCVCDLAKLDGIATRLTSPDPRISKGHDETRGSHCKPLSCEPPCKPETTQQDGQCPSCICRFEEHQGRNNNPTNPGREGSESERHYNVETQTQRGCHRPTCNPSCKIVSVNGQCPECICAPDQRTKELPRRQCPPAACQGEGCQAVSGPDGCPRCECSRDTSPCPNSKEEEHNCREPCEWIAKPKSGGCPKCLCPRDSEDFSGQPSSVLPRKCRNTSISACEGVDCRLIPGSDGCPTCSCKPLNCGHQPTCRAPCIVENQPNGRCPICVCPAQPYD